ncbi:MAG: nucleotidyl transferase AbiEii/AbiGii toxin family protein [Chitinophagales bacterium]
MIDKDSLNIDWIKEVSSKNRKADPQLVEKVIRALLLLEGLVESQLDFVFKGGTALMLKLDSTKRLSIDIDIIVPNIDDSLEVKLEGFLEAKGFTKVELHERNAYSEIEKAHYKFFYTPIHQSGRTEDNILLDILFEKVQYEKIEMIDIHSSFLVQKGLPKKVAVPSFEDLLGDKLTAFAPETTGIPYEKGGQSKAMEIIKQLYDIGNIFDTIENLERVASTFERFALTELAYRYKGMDIQVVLDDIFQTALTVSTRGKEGTANFKALQEGVSQVKAFIFSESYHIEKAIVHVAKAAYLAKLIQYKSTSFFRFDKPVEVKDWVIKQPFFTRLNKLKKSNPEAFFYWFQVYRLEREK